MRRHEHLEAQLAAAVDRERDANEQRSIAEQHRIAAEQQIGKFEARAAFVDRVADDAAARARAREAELKASTDARLEEGRIADSSLRRLCAELEEARGQLDSLAAGRAAAEEGRRRRARRRGGGGGGVGAPD